MPIPESQRVVYAKNPLEEVICQLRFPSILRIDTETPASFQESIRDDFPLFEEQRRFEMELPSPKEIAKHMGGNLPIHPGIAHYHFKSTDERWKLTLTREFLALTSREYQRWEQFREKIEQPLDAFQHEYAPAFCTRIGLRYRDVIRRSVLGLDDHDWPALLKPHIAGELSAPEVAGEIEHAVREIDIRLDDIPARVRVKHGLARQGETDELCYLIDSDFFTEETTEVGDVLQVLDRLNRQAGWLFRWCISDHLHEALGPKPI